jgi:hypothetical protein
MLDSPLSTKTSRFLAHIEGEREQSLISHLIGVSALSQKHAAKVGLGSAGALAGLLHDFGNILLLFRNIFAVLRQMKIPSLRTSSAGKSIIRLQGRSGYGGNSSRAVIMRVLRARSLRSASHRTTRG